MAYDLIYEDKRIRAAFFKDSAFGIFLFTEKLKEKITFPKKLNIILNENDLNIVSIDPSYKSFEIVYGNSYIYAFIKNDFDNFNFSFYKLDELNDNTLFNTYDLLFYLSKIVKMPNGNYVCGSVQDYITTIEDIKKKYPKSETFFRGHYSYKFSLIPSLFRKSKYYENESKMYMDFKTQFYNELSNKKYIEILTTMQHYKMPTRLLDTTSNPLVALFMAVSDLNYKSTNNIGEVIIMNPLKNDIKYSDSNAICLLSSLAVLETKYKAELYKKIMEAKEKNDINILRESLAYKRFVAEVTTELPYFDESFFQMDVLLKPRHVKVGMINERIIAQSGSFILFGLFDYDNEKYINLDTNTKERVFIVNKPYISKQLELLNINTGTMYPDKDHMSSVITASYDEE